MKQAITPVLLLTGYLGSGKTTLLNRILANKRGIRFAVVVNDIGEVNIDETLIRKEGIVGGKKLRRPCGPAKRLHLLHPENGPRQTAGRPDSLVNV